MSRIKLLFVALAVLIVFACNKDSKKAKHKVAQESKQELIDRVFAFSEKQYDSLVRRIEVNKPLLQPRGVTEDGGLRLRPFQDWTSGFFPGSLWYLFEYSQSDNGKIELSCLLWH